MKKILGILLFFVYLTADAALIDNGTYTSDTLSGLDWLELSETSSQSYADALTNNPGWRHATNAEVENLFTISFVNYVENSASEHLSTTSFGDYPGQSTDVSTFLGLIGQSNSFGSDLYSFGLYKDEDAIFRMMGTYALDNTFSVTAVYSDEYVTDYSSAASNGSPYFGTYIVRSSIVPVPAALWLFASALSGLAWSRRKKTV